MVSGIIKSNPVKIRFRFLMILSIIYKIKILYGIFNYQGKNTFVIFKIKKYIYIKLN